MNSIDNLVISEQLQTETVVYIAPSFYLQFGYYILSLFKLNIIFKLIIRLDTHDPCPLDYLLAESGYIFGVVVGRSIIIVFRRQRATHRSDLAFQLAIL